MAVRRVSDVVRQARKIHQVGIASHPDRDPAADLADLEGMGEPGTGGVTLVRTDDLGLVGQSAQRGTVQNPRPIPGEGTAIVVAGAGESGHLRAFGDQPLYIGLVVLGS